MDSVTALKMIDTLANGVNPLTGEIMPESDVSQQPDMLRALFAASRALQEQRLCEFRQVSLPARAGQPWTTEEDGRLRAEFAGGLLLSKIAELHQRTRAGVHARSVNLGLIPGEVPGIERIRAACDPAYTQK